MKGRMHPLSARHGFGALVVILTSVVTACGVPGVMPSNQPAASDQTVKVQRGTVQTTVGASGVVQALREITLNFPSGETVKTVNVTVGQRVQEGTLLGTVDTTDLELAVHQQDANVASAQAKYDAAAAGATQKDIDVARAGVDAARAKYQATATINPKDIEVAQASVDAATAKYNALFPTAKDIQVAQSNVDAATAKYNALFPTPKDIAVAQANLDSAVAKYNALFPTPKDIQVAQANLDSAVAKYNGIIQGSVTPQDIANAEASVRSAQAKLDAVRAGSAKSDIISAQSKVQQAQQNLEKVKTDSANAKEQARIKWEQSADATRDAQRKFDVANATYRQAASTNTDPSASGASSGSSGAQPTVCTPAATAGAGTAVKPQPTVCTQPAKATALPPTITPLKLASYKQAADSAYLAEQQAEKTQEANRLAYEQSKQDEINNINTAQQQVNDAQAALSKLVAGPAPEDVTQAQAALDQAKAQLSKLKNGPQPADVAAAQAAVDSARASLNDLKNGPKAADLASAQAGIDSAQATLNDLKNGPKPADLASAQASIDSAQATLNDLKNGPKPADLASAQAGIDSAQAALNDLLAGPKGTDLSQAQATVNSAQATLNDLLAGPKTTDLETALAALDQAKSQRELAQLKVDQGTIRAPFTGVLTQVNVVPGQITGGGTGTTSSASSAAFDLVDDTQLHIDVNVSESDSTNVKTGQSAVVTLDSVPNTPLQGTVERINPVATTTSNVTSFPVRIALNPTTVPVRPGANATVQIVTNRRTNVLVVPNRAIQTINGQQAVTVLFKGSTFLVPVRTGLSDGRNTEILGGLNEGDTVVLPKSGSSTGGATGGGQTGGGQPGGGPRQGG